MSPMNPTLVKPCHEIDWIKIPNEINNAPSLIFIMEGGPKTS